MNSLEDVPEMLDCEDILSQTSAGVVVIASRRDDVFVDATAKELLKLGDDVTPVDFPEHFSRIIGLDVSAHLETVPMKSVPETGYELPTATWDNSITAYTNGKCWILDLSTDQNETQQREVLLERQRDLLRQTERVAQTGGWEIEIKSGGLYWSHGTKRIHGVDLSYEPTLEDAIGFYLQDDRERIREVVSQAIEAKESYDVTLRIETPAGDTKWIKSTGEPVIKDGVLTHLRGAVQDITERQKADEQRKMLERAIDSAPIGVTIADANKNDEPLVYVNAGFTELTGYDTAAAIGENCRFLQGENTDERQVKRVREAIEKEFPRTVELLNYDKNGDEFWNQLTVAPIKDETGTATHFVGIQNDVSTRRRFESELAKFRQAVESAGHAIYITDPDGTITYVNSAFEETTQYSEHEVLGKTPNILNSGEMPEEYFNQLWSTITAGNVLEADIIDQRKSGQRYHAHQTIAPIIDGMDDIQGFVAIQTDTTDQIERKQRITVLDRVLRHNLRNDMNVILGHAEIIAAEETETEARRQSAEKIQCVGNNLLSLVQKERKVVELLSAPMRIEVLSVSTVLEDAVTRIRQEYPEAEIDMMYEGTDTVRASQQLSEAVRELIENAIIHNDREVPQVEISVTEDTETLAIHVADNSTTIPEQERDIVTGDKHTSPLYHGSGMGLWLVKWIIDRSGGRLEFAENEPRGNIVQIIIQRVITG
ncbi:PAS domain S-box protein [Halorubraceae archaeon YAN]|nr:PAS domain S-box protein [Halorubraceae archaeon YAN]